MGGIYLIKDDKQLIEMVEQAYDSEELLQRLLEDYPLLLAGDQIDGDVPRRWLLISREAGVPDSEGGINRWSVDHLFLDQDGIPTLVEVKRSSDTRVRREVVGQMLDYAANAVVYWPVESIRSQFEERFAGDERDPSEYIGAQLGLVIDVDQFWQKVKTNLEAGKVRMLFVADKIPTELQRIVEFLNEQMNPAEVLAIQVKQYVGEGHKTLVPRVIGQTARAAVGKGGITRAKKKWDDSSFFEDLKARGGAEDVQTARRILEWTQSGGLRIWWGEGAQSGSFFPLFDHNETTYWTISVWTYGKIEIQFEVLKSRPPFDDEAKRIELREQLNAIPGVRIPQDGITRRPSIPLSVLRDENVLKRFLDVLGWMISQIRNDSVP